jgi:hypothetical protein
VEHLGLNTRNACSYSELRHPRHQSICAPSATTCIHSPTAPVFVSTHGITPLMRFTYCLCLEPALVPDWALAPAISFHQYSRWRPVSFLSVLRNSCPRLPLRAHATSMPGHTHPHPQCTTLTIECMLLKAHATSLRPHGFSRVVILGVQKLLGRPNRRAVLSITSSTNQTYWTYSLNILLKYLEYT